jgi:predicted DNA-binding transcriptional regulator YafY
MSETTSGRLLKLLSLLQGRRDWPGNELAERLGVSCRTIRRDIDRLRELGYPVASLTGPAGGYRLAAGTAMPPLLLDDDEAIAIAVGLRTAAGSAVAGIEETAVRALVKLEQVLPAHLRRRVAAFGVATQSTFGTPQQTIDPGDLALLATSCRDHTCVRFAYEGRDGRRSRREVEPHGLVIRGRRWYLVAFDPTRGGWRTFRLDRLEKPSAGVRFTPRTIPGGGDAAAYVARTIKEMPHRYHAHLRLHAPAATFDDRLGSMGGAVTTLDDRTCEYRTSDDHLEWLATRIAMLGVDFDLLEAPEELRAQLADLGARLGRATTPG